MTSLLLHISKGSARSVTSPSLTSFLSIPFLLALLSLPWFGLSSELTYMLMRWICLLNGLPTCSLTQFSRLPSMIFPKWKFKHISLVFKYFSARSIEAFHFPWYFIPLALPFFLPVFSLSTIPDVSSQAHLFVFWTCLQHIMCSLPGMPSPSSILQPCSDFYFLICLSSTFFLSATISFLLSATVVPWLYLYHNTWYLAAENFHMFIFPFKL